MTERSEVYRPRLSPQDAARLLVEYIYENSSTEGPTFNVLGTDLGVNIPTDDGGSWLGLVALDACVRLEFEGQPYAVDTDRQVDGWVVRYTGDRNQEEDAR